MNKNRCFLCGDEIPKHLGVYLDGKLYCNQRHAEIGFMGGCVVDYRAEGDKQ